MSDQVRSSPEGYEIRHEIGRGATAVVYLAFDRKHDRMVALKVLQPNVMLTPTRFGEEIRIIAGLQHPHILPLHDSGVWDESPFFVMPHVAGESLADRMAREGPLPLKEVSRIAHEVGDALEYAHKRGIVHRDIKPANILLADSHAYVADFGIAHVITMSVADRVTAAGFVVGTPDYMSPEQASGERQLDGRTDLYSLGCVIYEMMTGQPPFRLGNARAALARRMATSPPSVRTIRPEVPDAMAHVVDRLLEPGPDERYESAGQFLRALADAERPVTDTNRSVSHRGRTVVIAASALVATIGAGWYMTAARTPTDLLDRSTYAVFPFRHVDNAGNPWLNGDGCARLLHDAMARWDGVRLVDDMRVSDIWTRTHPRTVSDVITAARALRAGSIAWGEVVAVGDSLEIRAVAYDVNKGEAIRSASVRLARDAPQLERAFTTLADSILVGGQRGRDGAATGTRNLAALEAFLQGRAALDHFDLAGAEQKFRDALAIDEGYAHAHFWLARTLAWRSDADPDAWAGNATRAVSLASSLAPRDQMHASALLDLAEGRMADACRKYRTLIRGDSLDFAAWFGFGDCNARDQLVVRDAHSPSGFNFRGSYHAAITAYRRALALVPSYHGVERGLAFTRLSHRVLFTEESRLRRGVALTPDTQRFAAFPSMSAETLAFVPAPWTLATNAGNRPATERMAVAWSANTYGQVMAEWVRAFPASGDAHENYALGLESSSAIAGSNVGMPTAIASARRAVAASAGVDDRVRRTAMLTRLLLKGDSVAAARALADSALASWPQPSPSQAGYLAGLAALTGRASRAALLLARAAADSEHVPYADRNGKRPALPLDILSGALQLDAYASLGGPQDSVRTVFQRTSRLIDTWVAAPDRADARQSIFRNAFGMAYDQLAPLTTWTPAPQNDLVLAMRLAMARNDTAQARRASRAITAATASYAPGTMGIDRLYHHATMLLALGDTAAATGQLDAALGALPRARAILLKVIPQAAAIVPAMQLRADLAWRARDVPTFDRWARSAVQLWSDADPELRRPIDALRERLAARP